MSARLNPNRNAVRLLPQILADHSRTLGRPLTSHDKIAKMNSLGLTYGEMSLALGWTKPAVEAFHRKHGITYNRARPTK